MTLQKDLINAKSLDTPETRVRGSDLEPLVGLSVSVEEGRENTGRRGIAILIGYLRGVVASSGNNSPVSLKDANHVLLKIFKVFRRI